MAEEQVATLTDRWYRVLRRWLIR